jgi:hypothetical protein
MLPDTGRNAAPIRCNTKAMQQLIYVMHFRGQASASVEDAKVFRTTCSGTSCTIQTVVGPAGVESTLNANSGDLAFLETEIRPASKDAFEGQGSMTFGEDGDHELRFATIHPGHLASSGLAGVMEGSVSWHVSGGTGRFIAAKGLITSIFTLTDSGELSEYHCGLIFLPDGPAS